MFALIRVVGPIGILLATLPFAFGHLGKPELETLSTVIGGFAYGWLDWRTGSRLERLRPRLRPVVRDPPDGR